MYIRTFVIQKKQPDLAAYNPHFQKTAQRPVGFKKIVRNTNKNPSAKLSYTPLKTESSNSCIVVKT